MGLFLLVAVGMIVAAVLTIKKKDSYKPNIILLVPSGLGFGHLALLRYSATGSDTQGYNNTELEKHVVGVIKTYSASSTVSDAAAGTTALACGCKASNGQLGVCADGKVAGSFLEAAKIAGYKTGVVTTGKLTSPGPAAFMTHFPSATTDEGSIAEQEV